MGYEVIRIDEGTWRIEDSGVRFFVVAGSDRAVLIDSGMQVKNAIDIAKELTDLPIELINTHGDTDHVGSNHQFDKFYMNPAEASNYYKSHNGQGEIVPVYDGDVIDLGGRHLEVVVIPGHTPGSIALIDVERRVLFSGDSVQDGMIFMFGIQREIHAFLLSLKKLETYADRFDQIYPSHGSLPVDKNTIGKIYEGCSKIVAREIEGEDFEMFGNKIKKYNIGVANILFEN